MSWTVSDADGAAASALWTVTVRPNEPTVAVLGPTIVTTSDGACTYDFSVQTENATTWYWAMNGSPLRMAETATDLTGEYFAMAQVVDLQVVASGEDGDSATASLNVEALDRSSC